MFISVYKNTSELIVDEPATYDVTVMKQADDEDDLQGASPMQVMQTKERRMVHHPLPPRPNGYSPHSLLVRPS